MNHLSSESQHDSSTAKGMSPATKLTLLVIPLLLVGAGWVFWQQIRETPAREVAVTVPPYGLITVRVTTEPFPPTTTGPVQMILLMQAAGGSTVNLDRVTYSYTPPYGGEFIEVEATQIGRNAYEGILRFDDVGDWRVTIKIENDGHINEGAITIPVRPAI
jgi:hypothetical protein